MVKSCTRCRKHDVSFFSTASFALNHSSLFHFFFSCAIHETLALKTRYHLIFLEGITNKNQHKNAKIDYVRWNGQRRCTTANSCTPRVHGALAFPDISYRFDYHGIHWAFVLSRLRQSVFGAFRVNHGNLRFERCVNC